MCRSILSIILFLVYGSVVQAKSVDDLSAIRETSMNYMESWYKGDEKRMEDSLHVELAKRCLREGPNGVKELRHTTAPDMVFYTESGYGKKLWQKKYTIEVIVLDFFQNIANVKIITPHYLEYLHLVKIDENWVIVNALYENTLPTSD
jgi:hypothetical protein